MAGRRAFDYDTLERLYLEHGASWSTRQYQEVLTADNRRTDPNAPVVNYSTVNQVISRHRAEWEERAGTLPRRQVRLTEVAPPEGTLAAQWRMETEMRYLRELALDARGIEPRTASADALRSQALHWAKKMRAAHELVELSPDGRPYTRRATAREIDSEGNLISLMAYKIPGWRGVRI